METVGTKRVLEGVVVSTKMSKTIVVAVESRRRHPLYERVIKQTKKYLAHDETEQAVEGQRVRIEERRPLSKCKRWELLEVVE